MAFPPFSNPHFLLLLLLCYGNLQKDYFTTSPHSEIIRNPHVSSVTTVEVNGPPFKAK